MEAPNFANLWGQLIEAQAKMLKAKASRDRYRDLFAAAEADLRTADQEASKAEDAIIEASIALAASA